VLKYIIPVIVFSALFNIPKFFETAVYQHTVEDKRYVDSEVDSLQGT
jgi:hypothetical protein